jgi:hypothetical protein
VHHYREEESIGRRSTAVLEREREGERARAEEKVKQNEKEN